MDTIEDVGFLFDFKEKTSQNAIHVINSDAFFGTTPEKKKEKSRYLDKIIKTQICKIDKMVTD